LSSHSSFALIIFVHACTGYISRDSSTGYITIKLYRRDLQEYVVEVESTQNWQFDDAMDNSKVPVGFYLNAMVADWQGVYLWSSGSGPTVSPTKVVS